MAGRRGDSHAVTRSGKTLGRGLAKLLRISRIIPMRLHRLDKFRTMAEIGRATSAGRACRLRRRRMARGRRRGASRAWLSRLDDGVHGVAPDRSAGPRNGGIDETADMARARVMRMTPRGMVDPMRA